MNVCMVPARQGSERLARKNYLKIGEHSVLELAVLKALECGCFDRVVINTDDETLEDLASRMGVDFYLRSAELASSQATSDQVVLDFFVNNEAERVFWLNTVSPLQTITDIKNFVAIAQSDHWSSAVSVSHTQVHTIYDSTPLNFEWVNGFARTQDLLPVKCFNYAMMGWHRSKMGMLAEGQLFDERTELVESSRWSSFLLKNQSDMELIETLASVAPDQGI